MDWLYGFLIGVFNLLFLMFFLYLSLKPVARQFFFARREVIRKRVITSAWMLKKAQFRLKGIKEKIDSLPDDVASRREAIESASRQERDKIIAEARKLREHILNNMRKSARLERVHSMELIRKRLLLDAFRRARKHFEGSKDPKLQKRFVNRGLEDLTKDLSSGRADEISSYLNQ